MFSEMLGVPLSEIEDDDPEVVACTGLTKAEMVSKWHEDEQHHTAHVETALAERTGSETPRPAWTADHDHVREGRL